VQTVKITSQCRLWLGTVHKWPDDLQSDESAPEELVSAGSRVLTPEERELSKRRAQLICLQRKNEILKNAAVYIVNVALGSAHGAARMTTIFSSTSNAVSSRSASVDIDPLTRRQCAAPVA
jgi:hypothetical protein